MNTEAIRDSEAFYVEPKASEGENTLEELLEIVQKESEENFVPVHNKWSNWKTEMEKFNESVERLFPKHFVGIKEYIQQSYNDLNNTLQTELQPKNIRSMQF